MQYFQAVQEGKKRAGKSQMRLFKIAGFAMLTLTTKKVDGKFVPVGEEDRAAVIENRDGHIVLITDEGGFTKAQTKAMERHEAAEVYKKVRDAGIEEYGGGQVEIWTESYPAIQGSL